MIQVEASPSFAGDDVTISSSQLSASAPTRRVRVRGHDATAATTATDVQVPLDDDGNVTVAVTGQDCAPGTSVVEASLDVAPYYTALGTGDGGPPASPLRACSPTPVQRHRDRRRGGDR